MQQADEKLALIEAQYAQSTLPEQPDKEQIERLLVQVRDGFYSS
jgi:hypothetical protein